MSGSFGPQLPSPFPSANALLDMERLRQAPQLAEDAHQNALMQRQVHQQTLGTNQIEYVARASAAIDGVPEAEQPALYQQLGQQLVDAGIIPTLPPYPGPARIKQLASLGTPAKEQQQMASDAATMRALAPPAPGTPPAAPGAAAPVAPAADGGVPFAANNPLNIRFVGQQGASNTRGFAAFPTPEAGQAATDAQFASYADKGINTLTGLISRWAPPSENDTPAYIARVAQATGIDPNAPIDLRDPAQSRKIQQAMAAVEGNKNAVVPGAGGGVAARTGGTNVAGPPGTAPGAAVAASAVVPGTEFTADQARQLAVFGAARGTKPADYLAMQERFRAANRADAAAARVESHQAQTLQQSKDAAAALAEQRRLENARAGVPTGMQRNAETGALEPMPGYRGATADERINYALKNDKPDSQEYTDAWRAKKWQMAPNGSVIENDMSEYPPPTRSVRRPTFLPQPTGTALDEVRKADTDARVIVPSIDRYVDLHKGVGGSSWGAYFDNPRDPKAQQLIGAFNAMKTVLRSPTYANTGVLQPAEMEMLKQELVSPQTIRGLYATPQALEARLHEIKFAILSRQDAELRSVGRDGVIVRDKSDLAKVPEGGKFYDEDGNLRIKPRAE